MMRAGCTVLEFQGYVVLYRPLIGFCVLELGKWWGVDVML